MRSHLRRPSRFALCIATLLPAMGLLIAPRVQAASAGVERTPAPVALQLAASPTYVDVGDAVTLTLSARSWGGRVAVTISFVSPHHGFSGPMAWVGRCACFRVAVALARRVHPLETARAKATVKFGKSTASAGTTFLIRGLAPNGRDYAPGGPVSLSTWVGDPAPVPGEYEHYCAWVKTPDGIGVAGYRVSFVVHFANKSSRWYAGSTGTSGILCSHRSIGNAQVGLPVSVDVYANNLRGHTGFTPRS